MEYLTVGTNKIRRKLFKPIEDRKGASYIVNIKPTGGLWLTEYNPEYANYNEWIDYLIDNPNVMAFKSKEYDIWNQPCSLVKLTDDSKIFTLENTEGYEFLTSRYPKDDNYFSYEAMSKNYDGIYIDILKLFNGIKYREQERLIRELCVRTLILFNYKCIDYYRPGYVSITPFNLDYGAYETAEYEIQCEKIRKRVR